MANVGRGFTLTITVAVELQFAPSEPVTVYVVVAVGLAERLLPVVALKPVDGVHV